MAPMLMIICLDFGQSMVIEKEERFCVRLTELQSYQTESAISTIC